MGESLKIVISLKVYSNYLGKINIVFYGKYVYNCYIEIFI